MSVTLLNVLNTPSALGVDASVDANGFLNLQGTPAFKATSIDSMTITPYVAERAQITTVTIATASPNALFSLSLVCSDVNSGMVSSVPLTVTSDSFTDATEICNAFRAAINSMPELSVTASGTSTLIVTAKAGFPIFTLSTTDAKMTIVTGTTGIVGVGTGTSLIGTYPSTAGYFNAGGFTAAANIVATNNYAQVLITSTTGGSAVILVNVAAANYDDLLGFYGTITGLKAGFRVVITAVPATTTAAVTATSGAIALSGGSTTFATLGAKSGDWIVIGSSITRITGITELRAGFGTATTTITAGTFEYAAWTNIPL